MYLPRSTNSIKDPDLQFKLKPSTSEYRLKSIDTNRMTRTSEFTHLTDNTSEAGRESPEQDTDVFDGEVDRGFMWPGVEPKLKTRLRHHTSNTVVLAIRSLISYTKPKDWLEEDCPSVEEVSGSMWDDSAGSEKEGFDQSIAQSFSHQNNTTQGLCGSPDRMSAERAPADLSSRSFKHHRKFEKLRTIDKVSPAVKSLIAMHARGQSLRNNDPDLDSDLLLQTSARTPPNAEKENTLAEKPIRKNLDMKQSTDTAQPKKPVSILSSRRGPLTKGLPKFSTEGAIGKKVRFSGKISVLLYNKKDPIPTKIVRQGKLHTGSNF